MRPFLCLLSILFVTNAAVVEFPSEIKKCKAGEVVCIAKAITAVINTFPKGNKAIGLHALEPLLLDNLPVTEGNEGPLSLKLSMKDMEIRGVSKATAISATGFNADPESSKFEMVLSLPSMEMKGTYNVDGRILLLPIQGEGTVNLTLDNVKVSIKLKPDVVKKDGHTYLKSNKIKALMEPQRMTLQLNNLFDGDSVLGQNMNIFLNDNWKQVWDELSPAINAAIVKISHSLLTDIFDRLPYDEFYV